MESTEAPVVSTASFDANSEPPGPRPRFTSILRSLTTPAFMAPALLVYSLFVLWPLVQVFWLALLHWPGYGPRHWAGLSNFADLANDSAFRASALHSVLWELGAILVCSSLGLALALIIAHSRIRSGGIALLFFPALLPATVVAAIWTLVYSPVSGPVNPVLRTVGLGRFAAGWLGDPHLALSALFVAWTWSAVGVGALLFAIGLQAIGRDYTELALAEGAGPVWRFRHVILPGLHRTIIVVLLINGALGLQVFDLVFVTTGGGPGDATVVMPLDIYSRAFGGRVGQGAAAACVEIVFLLVLVTLLRFTGRPIDSLDTGDPPIRRAGSWSATLALLLVLAAVLAPLGWLGVAALRPGRSLLLNPAWNWDPRTWDWGHFPAAWNAGLEGAIGASMLLAGTVVAGTLVLALPAAFSLESLLRSARLKSLAALILLAGLLQPSSVLIIPLFFLLKSLGLLDSFWGIILPEIARALPFAVLVLWSFLAGSPRDVREAAAADGASPWQLMLRIAIPTARPAIAAVAVWAFILSWNEYLLPTVVSQDGGIVTVPTLLSTFIGTFDTQFGLLAAGSLLAVAPSLLLYLVLRQPAAAGLRPAGRGLR